MCTEWHAPCATAKGRAEAGSRPPSPPSRKGLLTRRSPGETHATSSVGQILRHSIQRGAPFGRETWAKRAARPPRSPIVQPAAPPPAFAARRRRAAKAALPAAGFDLRQDAGDVRHGSETNAAVADHSRPSSVVWANSFCSLCAAPEILPCTLPRRPDRRSGGRTGQTIVVSSCAQSSERRGYAGRQTLWIRSAANIRAFTCVINRRAWCDSREQSLCPLAHAIRAFWRAVIQYQPYGAGTRSLR